MRFKIDHEVVLNMWAANKTPDEIGAAVGTMANSTIHDIVSHHRRLGDPRAGRRSNMGRSKAKEQLARTLDGMRKRRRLAKFPASESDLERAIAAYSGDVIHLQPGYHSGHVPKCLKALNY